MDASSADKFKDAFLAIGTPDRLVLDLSDVPSVDSAGLDTLMWTVKNVTGRGGAIAVVITDRPPLLRRLRHVALFADPALPVLEDLRQALAALGA